MSNSFEVETMVRGYHRYKEIWDAALGEQLQCERETDNIFAMAVLKSGVVVGMFQEKSPQSVLCFST